MYHSSKIATVFGAFFLLCNLGFAEQAVVTDEDTAREEYAAWAEQFDTSLQHHKGIIDLPNGVATLNIPEGLYYLSPEDSQRVLVEAWGNPAGAKPLGMLFPEGKSPLDPNAWGVTIEYSDDGYVSDEDAHEINYSDLLISMQKDAREESKARVRAGYETIELVNWAEQPYYDGVNHKLYWAKEIRFGEQEENTLNYNIRVLGRKGYLLMNFIASMDQLPEIRQNLDSVLAVAEFNEGYRYGEFNPEYDKYAAYGIGGLVAGKVLAKTGLIAAGLLFLKKFGVFLIAGIVGLGGKLFRRRA